MKKKLIHSKVFILIYMYERLINKSKITIKQLCDIFDISPITARKYLQELNYIMYDLRIFALSSGVIINRDGYYYLD